MTSFRKAFMILTALTAGVVALLGIQVLDRLPGLFAIMKLPLGVLLVAGLYKLLRSPWLSPKAKNETEI
jgi:hypothetical protein